MKVTEQKSLNKENDLPSVLHVFRRETVFLTDALRAVCVSVCVFVCLCFRRLALTDKDHCQI